MSDKIRIVCVVGPTASGKTGLGAAVAEEFSGEVVSADSMQIYKGMTIASAAPVSAEDTLGIPHHLVEFLDYGKSFTVADYVAEARCKIAEIASRGKLPVIVGGTGLYINSLVDNIEFTEQKTDLSLRAALEERFDRIGAEKMLEELRSIDPKTASRLHINDRRRIIRAFELYESAGITVSEQNELSRRNESPYNAVMIGINYRNRSLLYERINRRVDMMLEAGLVDEAKRAYDLRLDSGASQAIGHKELYPYFEGEKSLEEALEDLKRATRRYAKRQITWFGRDERINWIYPDENEDIVSLAINIIKEEAK